jgi:hypothetical protein
MLSGSPTRVGVVNLDTGQALPDFVVSVSNRRRSSMGRGAFFMVDQAKGAELMGAIAASRLPGESLRVLFAMLPFLDYDNAICIGHAYLSKQCGISRPAVSRSIKRLVEFGVLATGFPVPGGAVSYTLNPHFAWKGEAVKRTAAIVSFDAARSKAPSVPA